ncbi:AsmA family protein [Magnetofaba australis]|uniref:AsmA domain-containing protein n=1 Tax=Magnetofaba australis IT-1 TaxID=1434232 RepID=A0A1Y2K7L7_9PROT|nr:AsmA family protein [Magnetofaba australis]OSM06175.1 hypothetical protein MAIT1_01147 [Magnetofaba australis IT-1]
MKRIFNALFILVILVIAALVIIPLVIDPNDYRNEIAKLAKEQTGRNVQLNGPLELSLFPWVGVTLNDVILENAPGFGEKPMVSLKRADVRVKLIPLLSKQVQVARVEVDGLRAYLAQSADGGNNWADLAKGGAADDNKSSASKSSNSSDAEANPLAALAGLSIGGIALNDAQVTFDDAVAGQRIEVTQLNLTTDSVTLGQPVEAELKARVVTMALANGVAATAQDDVTLDFRGAIQPDLNMRWVALNNANISANGSAQQMPFARFGVETALDGLRYEIVERRLAIEKRSATVTLAEPRTGELPQSVKLTADGPLEMVLDTAQYLPRGTLKNQKIHLSVNNGATPNPVQSAEISLSGDVSLDLPAGKITLPQADLSLSSQLREQPARAAAVTWRGGVAVDLNAMRLTGRAEPLKISATGAPDAPFGQLEATHAGPFEVDLNGPSFDLKGLDIAIGVSGGALPMARLDAKLQGDLSADLKAGKINAPKMALQASGNGGALPTEKVAIFLTAPFAFDLNRQRIDLPGVELKVIGAGSETAQTQLKSLNLTLNSPAVVTLGEKGALAQLTNAKLDVKADGGVNGPFQTLETAYQGRLEFDAARSLLTLHRPSLSGKMTGASAPGGRADWLFNAASLQYDPTAGNLRMTDFSLTALEKLLNVSGSVQASSLTTQPQLSGDIALANTHVRKLMTRLEQPIPLTADPKTLQSLTLKTRFNASAQAFALSGMDVTLDQTRIRGAMSAPRFDKPSAHYDLIVDSIDLDRYLPPQQKGKGDKKAATKPAAKPTEPAQKEEDPFLALRELDLDGKLQVGRMTVNKMDARDVMMHVVSKNGVLEVKPLSAKIYGGAINASASIDARTDTPLMRVENRMDNVDIGALLRGQAEVDRIDGRGDIHLKLTSQGKEEAQIKRHLNGEMTLTARDGRIKGLDVLRQIYQAIRIAMGKQAKPVGDDTAFEHFSTTAKIVNGVMTHDDLRMKAKELRATGSGQVDLAAETLDYRLTAQVLRTDDGLQMESGETEIAVPVRFHGPWSNPKTEVDAGALVQTVLKTRLGNKLREKLQDKLKPKQQEKLNAIQNALPPDVQDVLKNLPIPLFGN